MPSSFILASENSGLKLTSWRAFFERTLIVSTRVCLVTGYVSNESLIRLREILSKSHSIKSFEMVIGMAKKDGLTKSQIEYLEDLDRFLTSRDLGQILISWSKPVHAKLVKFDNSFAIVGSSNLSALTSKGSPLEIDLIIEDPVGLRDIDKIQKQILQSSETFANVKNSIPLIFPKVTENLLHEIGVSRMLELPQKLKLANPKSFELPLKYEPKSHLNAFAAAPRTKGGEPRSWYEVEIGVSKAIRSLPGFPTYLGNRTIRVITDDGWEFDCHFSGADGKNFNSKGDLTILGRWIKGRLIDAGAINFGEPYTPQVAKRYGRTSVTLKATADPKTWIISFAAPKSAANKESLL